MLSVRRFWPVTFLCLGYLWFLLGIVWAPSSKLYQQGLVVLLWVPVLVVALVLRRPLFMQWRASTLFLGLLLALLAWAALSTTWTAAEEPLRELKRVLYVALFLVFFLIMAELRPTFVWKGLGMAFVALALSCPFSFYQFYLQEMNPLFARLAGMGEAAVTRPLRSSLPQPTHGPVTAEATALMTTEYMIWR